MSVAADDKKTVASRGHSAMRARAVSEQRISENSPRRLVAHTWVLTVRLLVRWRRDPATVLESLIMPVVLLVTLNIVLGDGISQLTGHSALYGSVPLIAMVGAMSGSMVGGIGLMRERADGLLSRLWVLPVHRASGLLSRLVADAVRIVVTTAVIMCAGLCAGFPFPAGSPGIGGVAVGPDCIRGGVHDGRHHRRLVRGEHDRGGGHRVVWGMLMFFSTGFVPLDQYPSWIQPVVQHQPMSYSIEAMRGLSLGGPVLAPVVEDAALVGGYRRCRARYRWQSDTEGQHAWMT